MQYRDSIYKLTDKLHWLKIAPEDGVLELYLDNQMLQTFRMCEARFYEDYIEGYRPKGTLGRIWFLDFGRAFHKAIEIFYISNKENKFDLYTFIGKIAKEVWDKYEMEYWAFEEVWASSKYNNYKELGGFIGFSSLLAQYALYFSKENEKFRIIGTELYFGKNKEVPLLGSWTYGEADYQYHIVNKLPFRLYLAGKIDLLIDDGFSIGPMDHKTSRDFRGQNPAHNYEIQEGMTGYVYAARKILANLQVGTLEEQVYTKGLNRQCNKIWMNFIQVKDPGKSKVFSDRFKRVPLYKTDWELEEYRQRQISTAARIYQLLANYQENRSGLRPNYNTMACTNWMHRDCIYQPIHRLNTLESQLTILNSSFVKNQAEIWNPEENENS